MTGTGTQIRSQRRSRPLENGELRLVMPSLAQNHPAQRFTCRASFAGFFPKGQAEGATHQAALRFGRRCRRRNGSSYSRYQTEPRKRGERNRKERANEAEVSRPSARNNSINNRRRLVNTAVITPNIKQPGGIWLIGRCGLRWGSE